MSTAEVWIRPGSGYKVRTGSGYDRSVRDPQLSFSLTRPEFVVTDFVERLETTRSLPRSCQNWQNDKCKQSPINTEPRALATGCYPLFSIKPKTDEVRLGSSRYRRRVRVVRCLGLACWRRPHVTEPRVATGCQTPTTHCLKNSTMAGGVWHPVATAPGSDFMSPGDNKFSLN